MKTRLTQLAVDKLKPPMRGRAEYHDTDLRGLGLRIFASGARSWFVMYRWHNRLRRHTIKFAAAPLVKDAREIARSIMRKVELGEDPSAQPVAVLTVNELASRFITEYSRPRNRSWRRADELLKRHVLPAWGKRAVNDVHRSDVRELLAKVSQKAPIGVNRVLGVIRKMFGWAVENDILQTSPVDHVKPLAKEQARERVLTDDELRAVWRAADALGGASGGFVKLLILTGQRRNEVSGMRWSEIDGDVWRLPASRTKANRGHEVPLSSLALSVLASLPHLSEFVFTMRGRRALSGHSQLKKRLLAHLEQPIPHWTFHDLRRSNSTLQARLGVPVDIIGKVLNHSESGVTRRVYVRATYLDDKRRALDAVAEHIGRLIGSNIIPLKAVV